MVKLKLVPLMAFWRRNRRMLGADVQAEKSKGSLRAVVRQCTRTLLDCHAPRLLETSLRRDISIVEVLDYSPHFAWVSLRHPFGLAQAGEGPVSLLMSLNTRIRFADLPSDFTHREHLESQIAKTGKPSSTCARIETKPTERSRSSVAMLRQPPCEDLTLGPNEVA